MNEDHKYAATNFRYQVYRLRRAIANGTDVTEPQAAIVKAMLLQLSPLSDEELLYSANDAEILAGRMVSDTALRCELKEEILGFTDGNFFLMPAGTLGYVNNDPIDDYDPLDHEWFFFPDGFNPAYCALITINEFKLVKEYD